jgi:hypothetical protein
MRVIIAGGRDFNNFKYFCLNVNESLDSLMYSDDPQDFEIISGGVNGADKLGEKFAKEGGFKLKIMPADWTTNGKYAGYIRNSEMADYAKKDSDYAILIAFWDGKSKGTKHMIDIAKNKNFDKIFIIPY